MNPLILVTFLVLGATANSYKQPSVLVKRSYGTIISPSSSSSPYSSSSSPSSQPSPYRQQTNPSSSSSYSAPAAAASPASYSSPSAQTYYSSSPASPSYYMSPSSSPTYGQSSSGDRNAAITSFTRNIQPSNSDTTSFTTSNGISSSHNVKVIRGRPSTYQAENGQMVDTDTTIEMSGHSYHQSPEGMHISLNWSGDEYGFKAEGDHLPKSVQMPADHAEAHRQAYLASSQSSSTGYGSINSNTGGYGGASSSPTSSNGYGSASSSPSSSGVYGGASSSPSSSGVYGGASSSPSTLGGYRVSSSSPSSSGGYRVSSSSPSTGGGYRVSSSSPSTGGGYGGAISSRSSSSPNYGRLQSPIILNYAPTAQRQFSSHRYY